jgi:hypothetical protein
MASEPYASDDRNGAADHKENAASSRTLRDIKADWRRWSVLERATAALVGVLSALVPLYLLLTPHLMP